MKMMLQESWTREVFHRMKKLPRSPGEIWGEKGSGNNDQETLTGATERLAHFQSRERIAEKQKRKNKPVKKKPKK